MHCHPINGLWKMLGERSYSVHLWPCSSLHWNPESFQPSLYLQSLQVISPALLFLHALLFNSDTIFFFYRQFLIEFMLLLSWISIENLGSPTFSVHSIQHYWIFCDCFYSSIYWNSIIKVKAWKWNHIKDEYTLLKIFCGLR